MFKLFGSKPPAGETVTLKLSGLHCASCSLNIDDALEDTPGVFRASTNYAKQESVITYNPHQVDLATLKKTIEALDYQVIS